MFQVVIVPKHTTANLALGFKTKEKALGVYKEIVSYKSAVITSDIDVGLPVFEDDYGYNFSIGSDDILYVLLVDVFESQMLTFDKNMAMDKANKEIEKKLNNLGFQAASAARKSSLIRS